MKTHIIKRQVFLETDVLSMGLRASLLQAKDRMSLPLNEVPDSTTLLPLAFTCKA